MLSCPLLFLFGSFSIILSISCSDVGLRNSDFSFLSIVDIEIFCRNVTHFFANATDISKLHKAIRLTYTTSRYLQDVVLANPCFHEMPPPPCPPKKPKKRNVHHSTWNY